MESEINDIVISCNKNDFFFTKICVASIRYFYPEINIFLLKDYSNGAFNTSEIEKYFRVKILDLGVAKYGWSGAKMHLLITEKLANKKYLSIDSDIIFCGYLLEHLSEKMGGADFIVSADVVEDPYNEYVKDCYYKFDDIKKLDSEFSFPGFVFNCGQMVITPGRINYSEIKEFFDFDSFPRWKRLDIFPLVDQSLLNYILPKKEQSGEIRIAKVSFMLWSESTTVAELDLVKIYQKVGYHQLIHWAGAVRTPYLSKMTRSDILSFFESQYYNKIPFGFFKKIKSKVLPICTFFLRENYRRLKRITKNK